MRSSFSRSATTVSISLLLAGGACTKRSLPPPSAAITAAELSARVAVIASDEFQDRGPGTSARASADREAIDRQVAGRPLGRERTRPLPANRDAKASVDE
jgi:hypothetical protein